MFVVCNSIVYDGQDNVCQDYERYRTKVQQQCQNNRGKNKNISKHIIPEPNVLKLERQQRNVRQHEPAQQHYHESINNKRTGILREKHKRD
jgi:hypothetical protein